MLPKIVKEWAKRFGITTDLVNFLTISLNDFV